MSYGYFSKDGHEFIITNPDTPRPWINYLTNENYCALISATGAGYSFYKDSKTERLTWFLGPNLHKDLPGKYIYLHDHDKQKNWSATWLPVKANYDSFEGHVGIGYQTIKQTCEKIETEVTYFVPRNETCEIWLVKVKNLDSTPRNLSLFAYTEWWLGSTDYINFYNIALLWNRAHFDQELQAILARKTAFYEEFNIKNNPYVAFFSSSEIPAGWDCRKASFIGVHRTEENPIAITSGSCKNSICDGEEAVGVLQHKISLQPAEEKKLVFILGQTKGELLAKETIQKYQSLKNAETELEAVKKSWRERVKNIEVETPDHDFNLMINIWVKYQLIICNMWSRSPSFYHEGQGGRGYRDSCQDAEGILALDLEHAKKKILKIASLTRRDGTVAPGWSDTYGPYPNRPFKDHPTWLTSTVAAYVKETGDINFLNTKVPWLIDRWTAGGTQIKPHWQGGAKEDGEGTLFEHLLAQLNFTFNDVSVHGLPRVGEADWNDALDMAGRRQIGESVWLAMALVRSLKLLAELANKLDKPEIAAELFQKAEIMSNRVNKDGWDEAGWYLAGYNDDLIPFGSSKNKEGRIFLNSQSWAILADLVPAGRLNTILNSVDKMLKSKHGLALLAPAYTKFDPGLGRIAMFSKGTKENAAIFCHAQTFMAAAYAKIGMGNKAYETMCQIMPNKQKDIELYKAEPYVYAEYLIGPEHPYAHGEGAYSWLTGTAGWTFMVATEMILGAQRDYDGLRIKPTLPSHWKKAKIIRPFRGAIYEIEIENPEGIEHGIVEVYVDGEKIEGNLIKPHHDGKTHKVRAIIRK
ncbi:MAG: GH36-type glycosyl hydrolase domain-containing protein [Candidatus Margulisiibacteriota bacterium]